LLESELFGYARGAFTGAIAAKPGRFELAHRGTLLLDEVGEMPMSLQPKLLRALQEREFERLGDTRTVHVDLRVISTTNRALAEMVREGKFRADLFYRLNVIPLSLPPLRERGADIRELAEYFLRQYGPHNKSLRLSEEFLERLERHRWPGNVRELSNCLRRAVALAAGTEIGCEGLEDWGWEEAESSGGRHAVNAVDDDRGNAQNENENENQKDDRLRAGISLEAMERRLLEMTLVATGGNRSRAAGLLGVSLRTVRNKIRSYGLPSWSSYVHD
jgi:transcriptional regulator with GAF, ATPase, and Fis domain